MRWSPLSPNDGQKGMGLIMLILVGTVPTAYALNHATPAGQVTQFVAMAQATQQSVNVACCACLPARPWRHGSGGTGRYRRSQGMRGQAPQDTSAQQRPGIVRPASYFKERRPFPLRNL